MVITFAVMLSFLVLRPAFFASGPAAEDGWFPVFQGEIPAEWTRARIPGARGNETLEFRIQAPLTPTAVKIEIWGTGPLAGWPSPTTVAGDVRTTEEWVGDAGPLGAVDLRASPGITGWIWVRRLPARGDDPATFDPGTPEELGPVELSPAPARSLPGGRSTR